MKAGDSKPLIRVHGRAAFNITNFAQFENITFTGEDNLVQLIESSENEQRMQDIIDASPVKFCSYKTEATSYLGNPEIELKQGVSADFNYTCFSGFNATTNQVTTQIDEECGEDLPTEPIGIRACPGEPNHSEFFEKSSYHYWSSYELYLSFQQAYDPTNDATCGEPGCYLEPEMSYLKRHRVLFNLYAFDSIHSNRTHAPTLNLFDCDFKYFHDKQALIQVENNNFVEMAISYTTN